MPHKPDLDLGHLRITAVGGPTAVLEFAGLRLVTDPTFDEPQVYEPRPGVTLTKTQGPAVALADIGPTDVVLLSHDHHMDNLDVSGREFLTKVPRVFTTPSGAERLGAQVTGMTPWSRTAVGTPAGGKLWITAVPAQHGPDGSEHLVGDVTGFVLSGEELPSVYISGDNASLDVVRDIAGRVGAIDIAVIFAGGAQMPYLGDAYLTVPSAQAAQAAEILASPVVVPLHFDSWAHFTQGAPSLQNEFRAAGLDERLVIIKPGHSVVLPVPERSVPAA